MQPTVSFELIAMLALLACFVAITSFRFGRLPLKPLYDARQIPPPPTQFMLTDFYALLGQIMFAGLLLRAIQGDVDTVNRFTLIQTSIITPLLVFWWVIGVRWLSQAGVRDALLRLEVLLIAVPPAFGGPLALLLIMISAFNGPRILGPTDPAAQAEHVRVLILLGSAAVIFYMYLSGCEKIASRSLRSRKERISNNNSFE